MYIIITRRGEFLLLYWFRTLCIQYYAQPPHSKRFEEHRLARREKTLAFAFITLTDTQIHKNDNLLHTHLYRRRCRHRRHHCWLCHYCCRRRRLP